MFFYFGFLISLLPFHCLSWKCLLFKVMWFGICFWFLSFITALGKVGHCPNAVEFHINKVASYEILIAIQGKSLVSNALFKQCCVGVLFLLVLTGAMSCYSVTVMIIVRAALHTFTFQRDQEALVYWSVLIVLAFVIKVQITFCFSIGFFFFFFYLDCDDNCFWYWRGVLLFVFFCYYCWSSSSFTVCVHVLWRCTGKTTLRF